ncbi:helix-turn-helix domain-containing protein [Nocardia cyriacigeorgica]|uniref:helix-turn-helix domain-containing protein n=1 Tax=Nocardia cyriacigeorgica TaxID=135487 RepID=UPI002453CA01|nr:helix-turn-helix transcriptional regulator [Nocardia cyriacigeorgica]
MQDTGSTLPRRQLGRYLMDWRTRAGLSLTQAAVLLEMGSTSLYRLEHGQNGRVNIAQIEAACELYAVPEHHAAAFVGLAQQANVTSWWHEFGDLIPEDFDVYLGLESAAQTFISYHAELVPGILQTADYTRALMRAARPDEPEAERERRVQMRQYRQMIVTRKRRPVEVDIVLYEAALRRTVGSRKTMSVQARHLADMSTRPNVTIRILPLAAGIPGACTGQFTILEFGTNGTGQPTEPPVVYVPSLTGGLYLEKPHAVRRYHEAYNAFRNAALDEVASRSLLRQVAKELQS